MWVQCVRLVTKSSSCGLVPRLQITVSGNTVTRSFPHPCLVPCASEFTTLSSSQSRLNVPQASSLGTPTQQAEYSLRQLPSLHDFDLKTNNGCHDFITTLGVTERETLLEQLGKDERKRRKLSRLPGQVVGKPTRKQLRQMFAFEAIPFVGFGFLDNVIMLICGDYIDMTFGTMLGISTLAAAGIGNLVSDIAGLGTAGYVEMMAGRMGLTMPNLTPEQISMSSVRWTTFFGRTLGVSIGCVLGMFPLFFLKTRQDLEEEEANKNVTEEEAANLLVRVKRDSKD